MKYQDNELLLLLAHNKTWHEIWSGSKKVHIVSRQHFQPGESILQHLNLGSWGKWKGEGGGGGGGRRGEVAGQSSDTQLAAKAFEEQILWSSFSFVFK